MEGQVCLHHCLEYEIVFYLSMPFLAVEEIFEDQGNGTFPNRQIYIHSNSA